MSFGSFLRRKRKERGYTQKQLAELLGVNRTSVSRYENDIMLPDISIFKDYRIKLALTREEFYKALEGDYDSEEVNFGNNMIIQCDLADLVRLVNLAKKNKNRGLSFAESKKENNVNKNA
jgi:transcriptional regulator with XRE-family HTH domain